MSDESDLPEDELLDMFDAGLEVALADYPMAQATSSSTPSRLTIVVANWAPWQETR